MNPNTERRRYERFECYLIAHRAVRGGEEQDCFGHVRNLSEGGALIETGEAVQVESRLNLTFLREDGRQVWEGTGRVIWMRRRGDQVFLGVHFDGPLDRIALAALRA